MKEAGSSSSGGKEVKYQKSYFDVLGICCPSEVPMIENILGSLDGIQKVSVIVPSKTVIVVHDSLTISQLQIVKELNQARLEASVRTYGTDKVIKKWPSPHILACGLLLVASLFKHFFHPLKWLAIAAVVVGLPPMILRSIAAIRRYRLDINILMLIAVVGAVALEDYSEAGFIVFLFIIAQWLESLASRKATAGMSSLMRMAPQKAIVAETGEIVDAQDVKINTILAVKAGELIPIDGVVVEGQSEVDERTLTGESFPVIKQPQSLVWAGTLNLNGYISVRTTALAEHSAVARMARLVEEAQNRRSKTQTLIDTCAKYYTPAVVIVAAGVAVIPLATRASNAKRWLRVALVLLVSACPCALVLSTPVATFCALLKAARTGLLIKGGDVLENLAGIKVVAFDKTGTLTKGEFTVMDFRSISSNVPLHTLLFWVASIESKSSHPMASALVDYAKSNSVHPKPESVREFHIYPGEGIHGEIEGKNIYIGSKRIASRAMCESVPSIEGKNGVNFGYMFLDKVPVGIFSLSDTCRSGATQALKELKSLGIKTAMLTGDSNEAAIHAQNQLRNAIEVIHAELLPEDKERLIGDLKARHGSIAMIGDGMNDAPSLARADVGISMGISGSAVAMETSHITLMSNDICKIPKVIRLARKTYYKIIQNIFISLIPKLAVLAFAFAGHPLLWAAVLADVGTCLLVILNSMMLLQSKGSKMNKHCTYLSNTSEGLRSVKHCAKDKEESSCSCQHEYSCHDNKKADEGKIQRNCTNQDCHVEPSISSNTCHKSTTCKATGNQEHSILITDEDGHGDRSYKKHTHKNVECSEKDVKEYCCKSRVLCGSSKSCRRTEEKKNGTCCKASGNQEHSISIKDVNEKGDDDGFLIKHTCKNVVSGEEAAKEDCCKNHCISRPSKVCNSTEERRNVACSQKDVKEDCCKTCVVCRSSKSCKGTEEERNDISCKASGNHEHSISIKDVNEKGDDDGLLIKHTCKNVVNGEEASKEDCCKNHSISRPSKVCKSTEERWNVVCSQKDVKEDCCKSRVVCRSSKSCTGTEEEKNDISCKTSGNHELSISIKDVNKRGDDNGLLIEHTSKNVVSSEEAAKEDCCKNHSISRPSKVCTGTEERRNDRCCVTDQDCGQEEGSSLGIMEGRMTGGCSSSYREKCGKKDACCSGGMVQLPEIITE